MNLAKMLSMESEGVPIASANVLIIDDEPLMRALIGRYVEGISKKNNLNTIACAALESGWDLLEAQLDHVQVAIVDILLPKITGVDLIKNLRRRFPRMGIIPITGMATDPMKRQLGEYLPPGTAILEKPLRSDEFEAAFKESLAFHAREMANNHGPTEIGFSAEDPSWTAVEAKPGQEVVHVKKRFRRKGDGD